MAARQYYHQESSPQFASDQEHLLSQNISSPEFSSGQPSPLRPLHLVTNIEPRKHYHGPDFYHDGHLHSATHKDAAIKARIRHLRVYSRLLALLISIAVLVPITMTLAKFLTTQNTYRTITTSTGQTLTRTAWAHNTRAWPTWAYFGVALTSVILNFATVVAYRFGVEKANTASYITSTFTWVVMTGNLAVWSAAAIMYRKEKDKDNKSNDLWGWTCSAAARAIQKEFAGEVDFGRYCNVQSISWYIGLVQVGAALLTVVIYIFALMRKNSKKEVELRMKMRGLEASRH